MPSQVTNYKCPACGGPLHFRGTTGLLECDYCGSTYTAAEMEDRMSGAEAKAADAFGSAWDASSLNSDWGQDADQMRAYSCPSCGAELLCDASTAASSCPYCGNPAIVPGQFSGALKPDFVLPFRLDKEAAVAALKKHYQGKFFLPRSFSNENHVQEIKGVYVPFWLFDGTADAEAEFAATRSETHREGKYQVTNTHHYQVRRAGTASFARVPVDASSKMPDDYMDSIEPYDDKEMRPFSTAYLPGFLADRYDVSVQDCAARADERCTNSAMQMLRDTVKGYETCSVVRQNVRLRRGKVHYALLPVWMLSTQWQGRNFLFAMNGQTGKLVGDLPIHWGKFWGTFLAIAAPLAAAMAWFLYR